MVKNRRADSTGSKFYRGRFSPVPGGLVLLALALALVLAACGEAAPSNTPIPATAAPSPTTAPTKAAAPTPTPTLGNPLSSATPGATGNGTTPNGTPLPGIPDEIKKPFTLISADLAKRGNLSPSSIQVTGFSAQTFPDSSLGCPDPNMMYTQVLTPGYTIQVTAGGQSYDYRSNRAGTHIVLCGADGRPVPSS